MNYQYGFENLLRQPWELVVAIFSLFCAVFIALSANFLVINGVMVCFFSGGCLLLAVLRGHEGWFIMRFQRHLFIQPVFSLRLGKIPKHSEKLYLGRGFAFTSVHRQRLFLLSHEYNDMMARKTMKNSSVGGKPWLHGVGYHEEKDIFIQQRDRHSHHLVLGTTRVGKTRLSSLMISQDIINDEAVLIIDPKGDLDLVKDIYSAAKTAHRCEDLLIVHAGYPEHSAKYNPLKVFSSVSEVATRITSGMKADGSSKAFKDFAWKYLNMTAMGLYIMEQPITFDRLSSYAQSPKQLLQVYCDQWLSSKVEHYGEEIEQILFEARQKAVNRKHAVAEMTRVQAIQECISRWVALDSQLTTLQDINGDYLLELYQASQLSDEYYQKITANIGPLLDKITTTQAGAIFSWDEACGSSEVILEEAIKNKQIIYIGLNAMENSVMSESIGKALVSDLLSVFGRIYNAPPSQLTLCCHIDEFSELVQDDMVTLLNKAGGAGVKITAYTQTVNDLGQAFSTKDKAQQLMGNFGSVTLLRVANKETAEVLTKSLQSVTGRSTIPVSTSTDGPYVGMMDVRVSHSDQIKEMPMPLVTLNDLFSLPKGQGFTLTSGGELYKCRFPLIIQSLPQAITMVNIMEEVNQCVA